MRSLAILVFAAGTVFAQGPPPASVVVAAVEEREIQSGRTFIGTVVPARRSAAGTEVEGRVDEYLVRVGDRVDAGQVLARINASMLQIQIAGARAELELRKSRLAELEAGSRPEEIDRARARAGAAEAILAYARWKLERSRKLFQAGTEAEDDLQSAVRATDEAERILDAARADLRLAEKGPRQEQIDQARAELKVQEEVIRRFEDDLAKHEIRAPFAGYVVREGTQIGEWLGKGGVVAEIFELDPVDIEVAVLEDYAMHLFQGAEAQVSLAAIPSRIFQGAVDRVVPSSDPRSRTLPVRVRLKNEPGREGMLLKAGMFARVTLAVGEKAKALLVPKDAIVLGGQAPIVYVVDADPARGGMKVVRPVPVEIGIAVGVMVEVRAPLQPGAMVVVRGNERIFPGQPVAIVEK